jgi:hypothetical protein
MHVADLGRRVQERVDRHRYDDVDRLNGPWRRVTDPVVVRPFFGEETLTGASAVGKPMPPTKDRACRTSNGGYRYFLAARSIRGRHHTLLERVKASWILVEAPLAGIRRERW